MDEITKIFSWIIDNPSWKKILVFFSFMLMLVGGLGFYEYYTASFRLARLQKEAELLTRLQQIPIEGTNIVSLTDTHRLLLSKTEDIIKEKSLSSALVIPKSELSKQNIFNFLAGAIFIWVSGLFLSMKGVFSKRDDSSSMQRLDIWLINLFLGICTGFLGLYIPHIWWPWFHLFIFPFLFSFGLIIVIIPIIVISAAFVAAREKAKSFNCINNLRQISAAKTIWALEKSKSPEAIPTEDDLKPYLAASNTLKCPKGGLYSINEVKSPPTCSEKGHSLSHP